MQAAGNSANEAVNQAWVNRLLLLAGVVKW